MGCCIKCDNECVHILKRLKSAYHFSNMGSIPSLWISKTWRINYEDLLFCLVPEPVRHNTLGLKGHWGEVWWRSKDVVRFYSSDCFAWSTLTSACSSNNAYRFELFLYFCNLHAEQYVFKFLWHGYYWFDRSNIIIELWRIIKRV